ncbi:DUF2628 domain-containing protein [Mycobacterium adipatum]|jgi:hypothetical protein|uniref:DUF2628 domain-containing protein n=1 Tax=Mycobacterium adipatum TaxID=1682113 RepID=UPI001C6AAB36|nr:DUF2628 domain-containing protein [Mycolicibacterium neoaurum]
MTAPEAGELAASWQRRFAFFDLYGLPNSSPTAKAAYRTLPFWDKVRLTSNVWALLFGFVYFYAKGMWRKGTTILGAGVGLGALLSVLHAPGFLSQVVTFGFAGAIMTTANYAYYLHVRGSRSWNPFEGFGPRA